MFAVVLSVVFLLSWTVKTSGTVITYRLDNSKICHSTGVVTKWMGDNDIIVIFGKRDPESVFTKCEMVFGPGTKATQLSTVIQFQTYFNNECGVHLLFEQSPYQFFDKEVTTVVNLTCINRPGATKFFTDAGNNLRITLRKSHVHLRNYNFIFNLTLTDHKTETHVSSVVIIVMGIIIAIIIPLIGCIVYKLLKIKRWTKQHYTSSVDLSPHDHQPLRSFEGHSTPPTVRYSSMPLVDQEANDSIPSQTCIVGSQRTDGRCTVCNRSHEDFAHVVGVDSQGVVIDEVPHGRLCHRSHEDFVHFEEINPNTSNLSSENQRLTNRNNPTLHGQSVTSAVRGTSRQFITRHGPTVNGRHGSEDEYELDVSGNDLIPPSYDDDDVCPPSYDEAIDMPKPCNRPQSTVEETESDPLYQNIDDILTENA